MKHTKKSLDLTEKISNEINNQTFHHHYHILYDIVMNYPTNYELNYLEIGCYGGGSASLVLQRPKTNVISVDLGVPISPSTVLGNINKLNIHNNKYNYIQGNSQSEDTFNNVKKISTEIDVLFIDGDHTYNGVKKDFELYSQLVKDGGYIIFDDYNDSIHSPEVKTYVNDLMKTLTIEYEVIGTLPNIFDARPSSLKDGNCFIIRKNVKFGIVIPTYKRLDGQTPLYLSRALNSIKSQTHTNYKVILIGDKYEDNDEFIKLSTEIIERDKIYFENLPIAMERDNYSNNKNALWSYGGVNATNYGISKSLELGYNYICHLDHDDYWDENHLFFINQVIKQTFSPFVCTKSKYLSNILPNINFNGDFIDFPPYCGRLIHSSTCIDFKKIPLRYVDIYKEHGFVGNPADGDLWIRINNWLSQNEINSWLINKITCFHEEEGYVKK